MLLILRVTHAFLHYLPNTVPTLHTCKCNVQLFVSLSIYVFSKVYLYSSFLYACQKLQKLCLCVGEIEGKKVGETMCRCNTSKSRGSQENQ